MSNRSRYPSSLVPEAAGSVIAHAAHDFPAGFPPIGVLLLPLVAAPAYTLQRHQCAPGNNRLPLNVFQRGRRKAIVNLLHRRTELELIDDYIERDTRPRYSDCSIFPRSYWIPGA